MARNVFRNGASLYRVVDDAPVEHLKAFLLQQDDNFRPVHQVLDPVFAANADEVSLRADLKDTLNRLPSEQAEPVEVECQRVLQLMDLKGSTSLKTIVERQLNNEDCDAFDDQPGDLARSLWAHVQHRRSFDDAVSFRSIRSWRNATRLFSAFNVDLDGKGERFSSAEIDTAKLSAAIGKKLKTSRPLSISLIDLPKVPDYPPSVLVIVRFAGQQASVATHGERGERRIIYFLPQDEAVLIYTPTNERIEVAATRATVRNAVAECFAVESLGHDVSAKPLTSAAYDTLRFLKSTDLPLPEIGGFTVVSARVTDLELRVENWQTRLALKTGGRTEMAKLVDRYLLPGHVLRRALGVSKVMMAIEYERQGEDQRKILELMISDGNSCSLNSERDPVIQNFGRKLLEAWGILRAFRDLSPREAIDHLPVMAELWELDQATQHGAYFSARGIETKAMADANLIRKKEIEPILIEDDDPDVEGPALSDRTVYAIDMDWLQERLTTALKGITDRAALDVIFNGFVALGVMQIDGRDVPCYLARGLDQMKVFASIDERLRARAGTGPGIVFTGKAVSTALIGANVVIPLVSTAGGEVTIGADRNAIARAFRAGRSLALGAHTLELVEDEDHAAARLHVPERAPLDLFGEHSVRAFRLLVEAAQRGAPGVRSRDLIMGSSSSGFQQMIGARRWPVVETYVESSEPRRWKLSGY